SRQNHTGDARTRRTSCRTPYAESQPCSTSRSTRSVLASPKTPSAPTGRGPHPTSRRRQRRWAQPSSTAPRSWVPRKPPNEVVVSEPAANLLGPVEVRHLAERLGVAPTKKLG